MGVLAHPLEGAAASEFPHQMGHQRFGGFVRQGQTVAGVHRGVAGGTQAGGGVVGGGKAGQQRLQQRLPPFLQSLFQQRGVFHRQHKAAVLFHIRAQSPGGNAAVMAPKIRQGQSAAAGGVQRRGGALPEPAQHQRPGPIHRAEAAHRLCQRGKAVPPGLAAVGGVQLEQPVSVGERRQFRLGAAHRQAAPFRDLAQHLIGGALQNGARIGAAQRQHVVVGLDAHRHTAPLRLGHGVHPQRDGIPPALHKDAVGERDLCAIQRVAAQGGAQLKGRLPHVYAAVLQFLPVDALVVDGHRATHQIGGAEVQHGAVGEGQCAGEPVGAGAGLQRGAAGLRYCVH